MASLPLALNTATGGTLRMLLRNQESNRQHELEMLKIDRERKDRAAGLGLDEGSSWSEIGKQKAQLARESQEFRSLQIEQYEDQIRKNREKEGLQTILNDFVLQHPDEGGLHGNEILRYMSEHGMSGEYKRLTELGGNITGITPTQEILKGDWTAGSRRKYNEAIHAGTDPDEAAKLLVADPMRQRQARVYDKQEAKLRRAEELLDLYYRDTGKMPVGLGQVALSQWVTDNPEVVKKEFSVKELPTLIGVLAQEGTILGESQESILASRQLTIKQKEVTQQINNISGAIRDHFINQFSGELIPETQALSFIKEAMATQFPDKTIPDEVIDGVYKKIVQDTKDSVQIVSPKVLDDIRRSQPKRAEQMQQMAALTVFSMPGDGFTDGDMTDVIEEINDAVTKQSGDYVTEDEDGRTLSINHAKIQTDLWDQLIGNIEKLDVFKNKKGSDSLRKFLTSNNPKRKKFLENAFYFIPSDRFAIKNIDIPQNEQTEAMAEFIRLLEENKTSHDYGYAQVLLETVRHQWYNSEEIKFTNEFVNNKANEIVGKAYQY